MTFIERKALTEPQAAMLADVVRRGDNFLISGVPAPAMDCPMICVSDESV